MADTLTVSDIDEWDGRLSALTDGLGWLFARPEPRETFGLLLRALLADVGKKNCWGMSEYAGLANPKRLQHLLNAARWDAEALRDWLRGYVLDGLADGDAALVLDDTQVIKKGSKSVGVAPQHCGASGQTENCQGLVLLTYAGRYGHAFIDRALYLPRCWIDDAGRRAEAGVPADATLVTKPHLGIAMLRRALGDPQLRFRWLVADSGYGRDPKRRAFCHQRAVGYVLAVPVDLPLLGTRGEALRPDTLLADTPPAVWQRRSAGHGTTGERYWDWAAHQVTVKDQPAAPGLTHTLLIRRARTVKITKKHPEGIVEIEYFLAHHRIGTPIPELIRAAGLRWTIEDDNKIGKDQVGLGDYQVRKWTPWHRHVTVSMLAHAFLAVTRAELGKDHDPTDPPADPPADPH